MSLFDFKKRFSKTAGDYDAHRPSYPDALLDWIVKEAGARPGSVAADLGCGTGIFSRLLAARGVTVVGVEPNAEMLAYARARGGGPEYRAGEAAATGLPDAGADLATAAQAFHWFPVAETLRELARILRPDASAFAVWNVRVDDTPFLRGYDALLMEHSAEYRALEADEAAAERIRASPRVRDWRTAEFASVQVLGREGFLGRARSSSYVAHGVERPEELMAALGALFDAHARGGRAEFHYRTLGFAWRLYASRASARSKGDRPFRAL